MTARVAVVVPVRDGAGTLATLLDALAAQTDAPPYDVVVVDNGSRDATAAIARSHPVRPRVIEEPRPGSYAARNAGWRAADADADVIAFTDADCTPDPGWLVTAAAAIDAGADLVGGRVEVRTGPDASVWERLDAGHYLDQRRNVEEQGFAATANCVVRRAVLEQLGGFRDELRSGGDRELCRRALAAGHTIRYADDALVWHRPRSTWRETWQLNRRIGYSLRDLHRLGMHPAWWRDQQMVLSPRWARGTSSTPQVRTAKAPAIAAWLTVIGARWVGRATGR